MDWIRSWIFTGFPWGLFPSSQWQHPLLFQICEYTGIYGLDFLLIFANFAIFFLLFEIRNTAGSKKIRISPVPVVFLLLLLLNILAGTYLMERQKEKNLKEPHTIFHAGIVQPHLSQRRMASNPEFLEALQVCSDLTSDLLQPDSPIKPQAVIWPES